VVPGLRRREPTTAQRGSRSLEASAKADLAPAVPGVDLPDPAPLVERTEGWAAGLRLAALSLAGHPDHGRLAAEFSGTELARRHGWSNESAFGVACLVLGAGLTWQRRLDEAPRRGLSVAKRPQPPLRLPMSQPYLALSSAAERGDSVRPMPAIGQFPASCDSSPLPRR